MLIQMICKTNGKICGFLEDDSDRIKSKAINILKSLSWDIRNTMEDIVLIDDGIRKIKKSDNSMLDGMEFYLPGGLALRFDNSDSQ